MEYEWNILKATSNIAKHGISFESASSFEWDAAIIVEETSHDYGEQRYKAIGFIESQCFALVFTPRINSVRIISLRPASKKERRLHNE